jgi:hypothetical protein
VAEVKFGKKIFEGPIPTAKNEQMKIYIGCPDGEIGSKAGLKHLCLHWHAGSLPAGNLEKILMVEES